MHEKKAFYRLKSLDNSIPKSLAHTTKITEKILYVPLPPHLLLWLTLNFAKNNSKEEKISQTIAEKTGLSQYQKKIKLLKKTAHHYLDKKINKIKLFNYY